MSLSLSLSHSLFIMTRRSRCERTVVLCLLRRLTESCVLRESEWQLSVGAHWALKTSSSGPNSPILASLLPLVGSDDGLPPLLSGSSSVPVVELFAQRVACKAASQRHLAHVLGR